MADCELTAKCLFFNDKMANMPSMAGMMKRKYCQGDFNNCARFMVCKALGMDKVPADLSPSQTDRAKELIG